MKAMFEMPLTVIATASGDGTPNVGPKGSMRVVDDEMLAYAEKHRGENAYKSSAES